MSERLKIKKKGSCSKANLVYMCMIFFLIDFIATVFLLVVPCGMRDLSFLTKDRTCASALEGKILTTALPRKSLDFIFGGFSGS